MVQSCQISAEYYSCLVGPGCRYCYACLDLLVYDDGRTALGISWGKGLGYNSHLVVVLVLFGRGRLQRGHFWVDESRHKIMNYP